MAVSLAPELIACLPDRLHPVSRIFLDQWVDGSMSTTEFLRWFHMPNSDYLEVAQCLLRAAATGALPTA
jgi:hypothetical protein